MKNFETLYKIIMNEADYEDVQELENTESDLEDENPSDANPRNAKIKNITSLNPELSEMDAAKIVDADLYEIFVQNYSTKGEVEDEFDAGLDGAEVTDVEGEDMYDIPAYDSQMRQNQAETEDEQ